MARFSYGCVKHRAERVAIIATGPSLYGVAPVFSRKVARIGVGAAVEFLNLDYWFTLDPSTINRRRLREQKRGIVYYAAVPEAYGDPQGPFPEPPEAGVIFLRRVTGDGHGRYRSKAGLSPDPGAIHTGNSAWGALQLAVHMGARRIALFGVDGTKDGYAYGSGRPTAAIDVMPELFASACSELQDRGIEVVNGSPNSMVRCFPRMMPKEAMAWLAA